jgi:drug/metabolite transporter (DMT)-like permease
MGETLIPLRLVGGALVFAAGLVLAGKTSAKTMGILFSILAAAMIATLTAFDKYMIVEVGLAEYVFPSKLAVAIIMWAIVFMGKRPVNTEFIKSRWCPILMAFRCVAAYGIMLALSLGALISVSTYISTLTCVTTPIAAFIFLKETGSLRRKATAAAIALAGVTFIFIAIH